VQIKAKQESEKERKGADSYIEKKNDPARGSRPVLDHFVKKIHRVNPYH
jgi:hypothetical protein